MQVMDLKDVSLFLPFIGNKAGLQKPIITNRVIILCHVTSSRILSVQRIHLTKMVHANVLTNTIITTVLCVFMEKDTERFARQAQNAHLLVWSVQRHILVRQPLYAVVQRAHTIMTFGLKHVQL
jgi:hypothetical protein